MPTHRGVRRSQIPTEPDLDYNAPTARRDVIRENRMLRAGSGVLLLLLMSLTLAGCAGARHADPAGSATPVTDPIATELPATGTARPSPEALLTPTPLPPTPKPTATASPTRTRPPVPTPQPLVPTALASRTTTVATGQAPRGTATALATIAAAGQARKLPLATPGPDRRRVCVGVPEEELADYDWGAGAPGLYVNWRVVPNLPKTGGVRFAQLVRTRRDTISPGLAVIRATARRNPGSLWLVGNEPDVIFQDNSTPEQYAKSYGLVYQAIKETDPSAQVAIAGVGQPTPLRMAYLDRVLAAYRQQYGAEMPVDVWNVHAYILREERGSWGVGIPPGMEVDQGQLYEIKDHADMVLFKQQIADFRRWMAERGQRDKPLIVSEFGILMPVDYGFPPEVVGRFLVDTFDYFLQARDEQTGYPGDDNRLVQTFCWFSAAAFEWPVSDLFNPVTHAITPVGKVFRAYVAALK